MLTIGAMQKLTSLKSQRVNMLDFVCHYVSVTTAQICHCSVKAALPQALYENSSFTTSF